MFPITPELLEELIEECKAAKSDTSKLEKQLAELKANKSILTGNNPNEMKKGNIRIYSMAGVEESHFEDLKKDLK